MVVIKKIGDEYYLCKKKRGLYRGSHIIQNKWTNIFRIKADWYTSVKFKLNKVSVYCPKELFGKKIMLKVVVIEDKKKEFKFENMGDIYG